MPIDPQFLPETALLIAAVFSGVAAIRFLLVGRRADALKAAAGALGCIALAFVLAKTMHRESETLALTPAVKSSAEAPTGKPATALVLGGVLVRVASAEQYVLSVEGAPFLTLDLERSKLRVTCTVQSEQGDAAKIVQNGVPARAGYLDTRRDAHTLLVQAGGKNVLRVFYASPTRVEIEGDFYERKRDEDTQVSIHRITFRKGIEWPGGRIAEGTTVDLTSQGAGRIDFGSDGAVRVTPAAGA
ncbi:MAG TPA: hypothetical protein VE326_04455 [Candidatus Binatia bacterium]|nr:hypothetical protein [Candidatus Binatia bacterium]